MFTFFSRLARSLGARTLKSGLAVFAALAVGHMTLPHYAVYAGLAAFLALEPSVGRSRAAIRRQLLGNTIGAGLAFGVAYTLGHGAAAMAAGVVALLLVLRWLDLPETIGLAVVTLLFVLDRPEGEVLQYGLYRVGAIFLGTLIGYLINRFVSPPDYRSNLYRHLLTAGNRVDMLLDDVRGHLYEPETLSKAEIKARAAAVQEELDSCRQYLRLAEEDGGTLGESLRKGINTIGVFAERLMDIHKCLLLTPTLASDSREAISGALSALKVARQRAYVRFRPASGSPGPRDPEGLGSVEAALAGLQALVHGQVGAPESRQEGLALHSVWTNLEHMAWQLQSLERFLDAEQAAATSDPANP